MPESGERDIADSYASPVDVPEFIEWLRENGADEASIAWVAESLTPPSDEELATALEEQRRHLRVLTFFLERFAEIRPPDLAGDDPQYLPKAVAWAWGATVFRLVMAAGLLIESGLESEIGPLSRSVFEHTVFLSAIVKRPDEIIAAMSAEMIRRAKQRRELDADADEPLPFLERTLQEVMGSGADPRTRITVSGLIRDIGLGDSMVAMYGEMSQVVHPTIPGASRYMVRPGYMPGLGSVPNQKPGQTAAETQLLATHLLVTAAALDEMFPGLRALDRLKQPVAEH